MKYQIRPAEDADGHQLIRLIAGVFAEYPGCVMDVDGELPELRQIATYFRDHGGEFWVVEEQRRLIACGGYTQAQSTPSTPEPNLAAAGAHPSQVSGRSGVELKKLYVELHARRRGIARQLLQRVEAAAQGHAAPFVELWSDTRFITAHLFYEQNGYGRLPLTRFLHDQSHTEEYQFVKYLRQ